jgi:hypothetical protein
MLPLTFRPTGLRTLAAFARPADWSVIPDGQEIGCICEVHTAALSTGARTRPRRYL